MQVYLTYKHNKHSLVSNAISKNASSSAEAPDVVVHPAVSVPRRVIIVQESGLRRQSSSVQRSDSKRITPEPKRQSVSVPIHARPTATLVRLDWAFVVLHCALLQCDWVLLLSCLLKNKRSTVFNCCNNDLHWVTKRLFVMALVTDCSSRFCR